MHDCPHCGGQNLQVDHVKTVSGNPPTPEMVKELQEFLGCLLCGGSRKVSDETMQRVTNGIEFQDLRVHRNVGIRDAASQLGIQPSEVLRMENGLLRPELSRARKLWAKWLILAGNVREAKDYTANNGIVYWHYVTTPQQMLGLKKVLIKEIGTLADRRDAYLLRREAEALVAKGEAKWA